MRIVIDARMYQESGVGRYIRNLLEQIQILDKKNKYYILNLPNESNNQVYHTNFKNVLADFKWYSVSEQIRLPGILNKLKPDLVHFPHFNVPILYPGKFVVTIHDLIHQHFQMRRASTLNLLTYKIKQLGYNQIFKVATIKSVHILVPSNFVKGLLVDEWGVDNNKITVTKEAVGDKLLKIANKMSQVKISQVMKKFIIKPPYIFYVGNAHPHKNVEGLIKAFLLLKKKYKNLQLVLSGHDHYFWQRIKKENKYPGILYTGYVSDEEMVALYKNASCFVMPSLEEGFGIPLLEAMVCSCPVVSSNAESLPEIASDAAIYFNPHDVGDIGDKIDEVLKSEKLRKELIEKGKKRVKLFSWKKLAQQTLEVYQNADRAY